MSQSTKEALAVLVNGYQHLKDVTAQMDPDNVADVAIEAVSHVIEHFTLKGSDNEKFKQDFILVLYNAYMGPLKGDPSQSVFATGVYSAGDQNVSAHQLAEFMLFDPMIRNMVLHAVHVFHERQKKNR